MNIRSCANAFIAALGLVLASSANALPTLSVVNVSTASVGQRIGVEVNLGLASETVSAFQFDLNFDPSLMDVVCSGFVCGSKGVLNAGSSFFDAFNSSSGVVTVVDVFDIVGPDNGSIALIEFDLKAPTSGAQTQFSLSGLTLLDPLGAGIADYRADGSRLTIAAAVPLPGTAALLGLGLGLLGWMRRRQA